MTTTTTSLATKPQKRKGKKEGEAVHALHEVRRNLGGYLNSIAGNIQLTLGLASVKRHPVVA